MRLLYMDLVNRALSHRRITRVEHFSWSSEWEHFLLKKIRALNMVKRIGLLQKMQAFYGILKKMMQLSDIIIKENVST